MADLSQVNLDSLSTTPKNSVSLSDLNSDQEIITPKASNLPSDRNWAAYSAALHNKDDEPTTVLNNYQTVLDERQANGGESPTQEDLISRAVDKHMRGNAEGLV